MQNVESELSLSFGVQGLCTPFLSRVGVFCFLGFVGGPLLWQLFTSCRQFLASQDFGVVDGILESFFKKSVRWTVESFQYKV